MVTVSDKSGRGSETPVPAVIMVLVEGTLITTEHGRVSQDIDNDRRLASRLLGLDGVEVVEVDDEEDGRVTVGVRTSDPRAMLCPGCGGASAVKQQVTTSPADVEPGGRPMRVVWLKHRRVCPDPICPLRSFTESLPQIPPRKRLTVRLREHTAALVAERGLTPTQAAAMTDTSWPTVHRAFAERADPMLEAAPGPVAHVGIDEHRRGRPRWRKDPETGTYELVKDRWHTCFVDLSGDQGLIGQVEGRTTEQRRKLAKELTEGTCRALEWAVR